VFYLSGPGRGAEHCNQSVRLYVCMSRNVYQKSQVRTSLNFRRMLHVTVPGSSYGGVTICLCISGFVDDVMFTHRIGGGVRCLRLPCFVTDHLVVQANQSVVCMFVCPFVRMITFKRNGVLLRSDQPIRSWTWVKVHVAKLVGWTSSNSSPVQFATVISIFLVLTELVWNPHPRLLFRKLNACWMIRQTASHLACRAQTTTLFLHRSYLCLSTYIHTYIYTDLYRLAPKIVRTNLLRWHMMTRR